MLLLVIRRLALKHCFWSITVSWMCCNSFGASPGNCVARERSTSYRYIYRIYRRVLFNLVYLVYKTINLNAHVLIVILFLYTHAGRTPTGQRRRVIRFVKIAGGQSDRLHLVPKDDVFLKLDQSDIVPNQGRTVEWVYPFLDRCIFVTALIESVWPQHNGNDRIIEAKRDNGKRILFLYIC